MEREPTEPQHRIRLGECFKRLGQSAEARQQWLRAAQVWAADAQWEKATGACRLALAEDPFDLDVCLLLSGILKQRQKRIQRTPRQPGSSRDNVIDMEVEGWGDIARRLEPPPPLLPLAVDPLASSG